MKLLCVGDSITWGAWDLEGGWVSRVRRRFDQRWIESNHNEMVLTYNLGISSGTSEHALARLPAALEALSNEDDETAFVISLGTNDSVWRRSTQQYWIPIDDFSKNMASIVDLAKQHASKVLLLGSAGVDESKTHPYTYDDDIETSNNDILRYVAVTREVAKDKGVPFAPVYETFALHEPSQVLFRDGVHPSQNGHGLIADIVWGHVATWA